MAYQSVVGAACEERVIEKSRFLSFSQHVESEEEARAFLAALHEKHPLATHVCYAFIADKTGNLMRFSDDGEPQGTAGMPILGVIRAKKLYETAVAVVRYFGGVKLGAGGLTRAYAACAQDALNVAEIRQFDVCVELSVKIGYSEIDALQRFLSGYCVLDRAFGQEAVFTVAVQESAAEEFCAGITDFLRGKVVVERGKKYYAPIGG